MRSIARLTRRLPRDGKQLLQPRSLAEAVELLARTDADLLVIAGGTVAMPLINEGISLPHQVMGLRQAGLDAMRREGEELHIGATATLTALAGQSHSPLLAEAARHSASWAVRNMGTVGGNLFTPPPGGDVATALLALDARVDRGQLAWLARDSP